MEEEEEVNTEVDEESGEVFEMEIVLLAPSGALVVIMVY